MQEEGKGCVYNFNSIQLRVMRFYQLPMGEGVPQDVTLEQVALVVWEDIHRLLEK